ncbi:MAG: hypothetical protein QN130_12265 [Armatimonadota bacterium]|nr:hypothetical protein [Armatimonadota bacterium]
MPVMVRSNFQDIFDNLLPAIDSVYIQSRDLDESKAPWKKIFAVRRSNRQFENVTGFSGFPKFAPVGEGENVPLMTVGQLYDKKFLHTKWAGAWQVSEEMEDDDQYELVASLARAFARSFRYTKEVDMANVLNNAFGTEKAADGAAVLATHTLLNGNTISNKPATPTDFGVSAAQAAYDHFATLTDDQGIRIHLRPKYIVAHPSQRWIIGEVMRSQYQPATSNNAINVLFEENLVEVYWPELTDQDAWFMLADPGDVNGNGLRIYERQPFTTSTDFYVQNLTMISVGRGRWSRGVIDWRQIYGSEGA